MRGHISSWRKRETGSKGSQSSFVTRRSWRGKSLRISCQERRDETPDAVYNIQGFIRKSLSIVIASIRRMRSNLEPCNAQRLLRAFGPRNDAPFDFHTPGIFLLARSIISFKGGPVSMAILLQSSYSGIVLITLFLSPDTFTLTLP